MAYDAGAGSRSCVLTLQGHCGGVSSIVAVGASQGGCYVSTAVDGSSIIAVWASLHHQVQPCWRFSPGPNNYSSSNSNSSSGSPHLPSVTCLTSDESNLFFSAHSDRTLRVWSRAAPHKPVRTFPSFSDRFFHLLQQRNDKISDPFRPAPPSIPPLQHSDIISSLAFSPKSHLLYSGSWDSTVKAWSLNDFQCSETIYAHTAPVTALAVCPEGFLYTACANGEVKAWKKEFYVRRHGLMATLNQTDSKAMNALALSGDGELLIGAGEACAISIWGRKEGERHMSVLWARVMGCHGESILCLSAVGVFVVSGSADKKIRVWRVGRIQNHKRGAARLVCKRTLEGHTGPVLAIATVMASSTADHDGDKRARCLYVYSGSADKSMKVWKVDGLDDNEYSSNGNVEHSDQKIVASRHHRVVDMKDYPIFKPPGLLHMILHAPYSSFKQSFQSCCLAIARGLS
ncbi:hypothetical protein L7F22_067699 [Adiantum nelumboides]|nr:hypothetical protein [Adiantum nelumboides]